MTYPINFGNFESMIFPGLVVGYGLLKCWTHSSTFIVLRVFVQLTWDRDVQGMPHFRKQPSSLVACNLWYPSKGCNILIQHQICNGVVLVCNYYACFSFILTLYLGQLANVKHAFMFPTGKYIYHTPSSFLWGSLTDHSPDPEVKPPSWTYPMKSQVVAPKVPSYLRPRRIGRKAEDVGVCWMGTPVTRCPPPQSSKRTG